LLLNDLYIIQSLTETQNVIQATVQLREDHAIFKGHFPGQPVLPGVCMMEMITEIAGKYLQKEFRIYGGPMIKFLHMIDPRRNPLISVEIKHQTTYADTAVIGKIYFGSEIFMKFQLTLISNPVK
jgi:3-hydroxyacyl-[acyl-carrier-protein] dehydratase